MKRLWIVLGAVLIGSLAPLGAQFGGGDGLRVWEDANFRGRSATITEDYSNLDRVGMNDQISSLRAAPGERWEVCEHASFRGRCMIVSGNEPDLSRNNFDNIISSVRRLRDDNNNSRPPGFGPSRGVVLFAGTRWTGQTLEVRSATSNLERSNFNDRANSIQVARGETWEVCVDSNYAGRCVDVSDDVVDLDRIGMSRNITSLRPSGFGRGGGGGGGNAPRMTLFADPNFRGRSVTLTNGRASLDDFRDTAQSLQVSSGRWEVCDQTLFRGTCREVTGNIRDLRTIGMNNRIASARPR